MNTAFKGFSLIELLVVLSITSILMLVVAPTFNDAWLGNKLASYANDFVASATMARSEAIKRNTNVTLCASTCSASASTCSCAASGDWEQGWIIQVGTTQPPFHRSEALSSGLKMSGATTSIAFNPTGVDIATATLTLCRNSPTVGAQERVIAISATGRATVSKTTSGSCP